MSDPNAPPPPKKDTTTKAWLTGLGITFGIIAGVIGVLGVVGLALVGLVFWTCSRH